MKIHCLVLACALSGAAAWANPVVKAPDPHDPKLGVTALGFETGLRPAAPPAAVDPPSRWREHNDQVRETGGHLGLFRPSASARQPPTRTHGDHK